jgi:hypothetical protein
MIDFSDEANLGRLHRVLIANVYLEEEQAACVGSTSLYNESVEESPPSSGHTKLAPLWTRPKTSDPVSHG